MEEWTTPIEMDMGLWTALLRETARHDLPTARRAALLRLVWEESYLPRQGLVARVEALLGRGCFGSNQRATFHRDMRAVRQALAQNGHRLVYRRGPVGMGYYVEGRPLLDERLQKLIAGAVAEVDPRQIIIYRRLKPAQRVWQAAHLSDWLRGANERRLQPKGVS
jgi:hypothetical protein